MDCREMIGKIDYELLLINGSLGLVVNELEILQNKGAYVPKGCSSAEHESYMGGEFLKLGTDLFLTVCKINRDLEKIQQIVNKVADEI